MSIIAIYEYLILYLFKTKKNVYNIYISTCNLHNER